MVRISKFARRIQKRHSLEPLLAFLSRKVLLKLLLVLALALLILLSLLPAPQSSLTFLSPANDGGYLIFPLVMGRYGNQMEQLLGVLGSIKGTGRTLVLPPFTNYKDHRGTLNEFIPMESLFDIKRLREFYPKIISLKEFMETKAHEVWKERILYCPTDSCSISKHLADGQFWKQIGIEFFPKTVNFGLGGDLRDDNLLYRLSAREHPVIATTSAPARYPMQEKDRNIAKYFVWKDPPALPGDAVIVATHIRAGHDWVRACRGKDAIGSKDFFATPQCHSPSDDSFIVTESICLPSTQEIVEALRYAAARARRPNERLLLYVGSDVPTMARDLIMDPLSQVYDGVWELPSNDPFVDLAVMSTADYFVGNCVSSFTSFAARMRDSETTQFFGIDPSTRIGL